MKGPKVMVAKFAGDTKIVQTGFYQYRPVSELQVTIVQQAIQQFVTDSFSSIRLCIICAHPGMDIRPRTFSLKRVVPVAPCVLGDPEISRKLLLLDCFFKTKADLLLHSLLKDLCDTCCRQIALTAYPSQTVHQPRLERLPVASDYSTLGHLTIPARRHRQSLLTASAPPDLPPPLRICLRHSGSASATPDLPPPLRICLRPSGSASAPPDLPPPLQSKNPAPTLEIWTKPLLLATLIMNSHTLNILVLVLMFLFCMFLHKHSSNIPQTSNWLVPGPSRFWERFFFVCV
ncbi:uncharacterized protein [Heterodontus francisci]|uniref:uncharacterized protein n=1 Tax=Heterodontus francisci TaxID=7792 RepID=UPI00355BB2E0